MTPAARLWFLGFSAASPGSETLSGVRTGGDPRSNFAALFTAVSQYIEEAASQHKLRYVTANLFSIRRMPERRNFESFEGSRRRDGC